MKVSIATTLLGLWLCIAVLEARAAERPPLPLDRFEKLHGLLQRQPHESRWMEIEWHPSVWEARKKAAAEGKPLFIWAGSGGAPAAGC